MKDIYQIGLTVPELAYFSSTRNTQTPIVGDYMIQLQYHQLGKDVSEISNVPSEQEVLFDSSMRHLISAIENVEKPSGRVRYVTTDEVLPNTVNRLSSHL